jgi:hypothetical protein
MKYRAGEIDTSPAFFLKVTLAGLQPRWEPSSRITIALLSPGCAVTRLPTARYSGAIYSKPLEFFLHIIVFLTFDPFGKIVSFR